MEDVDHMPNALADNLARVKSALETAGVDFIPENGGGAGVRLRKPAG